MWHRFLSCVTRRMLLLSQGGWEKKRTFAAKLRCAENCGNKLRLSAFQLYNVCVVVNFPVNSIPKRNGAPPNIYGICREIEQSQFYLFRLIWHLLEDRKKKMIAPLQWKQHYYIISKCKRTRPDYNYRNNTVQTIRFLFIKRLLCRLSSGSERSSYTLALLSMFANGPNDKFNLNFVPVNWIED